MKTHRRPVSFLLRRFACLLLALGLGLGGAVLLLIGPAQPLQAAGNVDLGVTQTASAPQVYGAPVTYTVAITNSAVATDGPVVLTDTLPAGATPISATTSAGVDCPLAAPVVCTFANAGAGQTLSATIAVNPGGAGQITNLVEVGVTVSDTDVFAGNNIYTLTTSVAKATPSLTWAAPAPITSGTPLGATQLNASASVPGTLDYTPPAGTVLSLGAHTLTATLTPTDLANYNTAIATVSISVVDAPVAGLTAANSSPTRLDDATNFTATIAAGTNVVYAWNFGDGSAVVNSANTAHTYAAAGTYTALVTATNSANTVSLSTPVTITNQRPVPAAGPDQSIFVNAAVTLNGAGSTDPDNHTPLTYRWTQTSGTAVTLSNAAVAGPTFSAPAAPSILTFSLMVTDSHGLPALAPDTVVITAADVPVAGLTAVNSSPTRLDDATHFTATIAAGTNVGYAWNFGDGSAVVNSANTAHTYAAAGTYTALVTATSSANTVSLSIPVTITNQRPVPAAGPDQTVFVNNTVALNGAGSTDPDNHTPLTYRWTQTAGTAVTLSSASVAGPTFSAPAAPSVLTFSLMVTDSHGLPALAPDTVVITAADVPVAGLTAANSSPTPLGQLTSFTATTTAGTNIGYAWDFGDGGTGAGLTTSRTYANAGSYTVTLTATNGAGAVTATTSVTVDNPKPTLSALGPVSRTLLGPAFTLTVTGTNFVGGPPASASVVRWNGADRPTTFVNGTTLTAAIPAADLASVGTASVTVFNPSPGGGLSTAQTVTVAPWPALTLADAQVAETTGVSTTLTFTLTLAGYTDQPAVITYTTSPVSASANVDYLSASGTVTFPAGTLTRPVTVTLVGDALDELDETFTLDLTGASFATLVDTQATGTILDDDPTPSVAFSTAAQTVAEPANVANATTTVNLTVTLSAASGLTVTVPYVVSGTAANGGASPDHTLLSGSFVIPPLNASRVFTFSVLNDALNEDPETVVVTLGTPQSATLGATPVQTVTITDNDPLPTLTFSPASYSQAENAGPVVLTAALSAVSGRVVTATYATSNGTALAGQDYTAASGTITLPAGTLTTTLSVPVTADSTYENNETFSITLTAAPNASLAGTLPATVTIANDDPAPTIQFAQAGYNVVEDDGAPTPAALAAPITVTLSNPSAFPISVNFATSNGTAVAGVDYVAASGTLTFAAGVTTQVFTVTTVADTLSDPDVSATLTLSAISGTASLGALAAVPLTVVDNDGTPNVRFNQPTYQFGEAAAPASVLVFLTLSNPSGVPLTVTVKSTDGTALAGSDYTAISQTVLFPANVTGAPLFLTLANDPLYEADEVFTLTLSNPQPAGLLVLGSNNITVPVTITSDDPPPQIQFSAAGYSVAENRGPVVITATLDRPSAFTTQVTFATSDGTATAANDYAARTQTLTFTPGATLVTTTVAITNDGTYEGNQTFTVGLSAPVNGTLGTQSGATVTIVEDDAPPQIQFSAAGYSIAEGAGSAVITATITGSRSGPAAISYATSNGTALAGSDYASRAGTLNFSPAAAALTFTVPITNEGLYEGNETLALTLSGPVSATLVGPATVTLTITEATPAPTLAISDVTLVEGDTGTASAVFTVTLTGPTALTATAAYATQDNTAQAGSDYTATAGPLTFPAGVTRTTVTVPVAGDRLYENDETFTVTLNSLVNAAAGRLSATGTLLNNDPLPTVTFAPASYTAGENAGPVVVTASLSNPSAFPAQVNYATSAGSALAGQDFVAASSTLAFAPGTTRQTLSLTLLNDQIAEPNEVFSVTLSSPTGLQLGAPATAGLLIANDDARAGCEIVNSANIPLAIPDAPATGITSTLTVAGPGMVISDVTVRIDDLQHTYISDLQIYLVAPNGTKIKLLDSIGGSGDNLIYTVLDDGAAVDFTHFPAAAPYTMAIRPFETLSVLNGTSSAGVWKLTAKDQVTGDTGTLKAWGLEICGAPIPVTGGPPYYVYLPMIRR